MARAVSIPQSKSQKLSLFVDTHMAIITHHTLHSIAFKPAESGWGAGKKYHQNYDDIFGKKDPKGGETAPDTQGKK